MYQAIKTYCESGGSAGLFLMDMPTGFGKTYSVLRYIFDACQLEENRERRYFFITPLKKNLPIQELRAHFEQAGKLSQFEEKFLFIDSNSESVLTHFTEALAREIPLPITKTEEFQRFRQEVQFLQTQRLKRPNDPALRQMAKGIETSFRERTEPAFRRMLTGILARRFAGVRERLEAVRTDPDWKWVGVLYPAVFTQERQILFLSMDKFLARNATLVEPSYQFCNSRIIDNAVIFMDEFDSAKETMLGSIIQNGLRDKIDFIELFHSIYAALKTHDFPEMLTTPSEQYKRGDYRTQSLEQLLADTHRKAQELHDLYALQFSHRTALDAEETHKNFLFQDHQFHSILSGNNRYITAVTDETRRINAIHFTQGKPDDKTQNLQVMLGKLRGFIGWFQGMVGILAINYRQCKNERRQAGEDEFTQEQAIRSVLAQFRLGSYETDYLTTQILMAARRQKNEQIAGSLFDRSVYEHGFRYYCFENDAMHDMQSQIMMCAFQNTPEKLLLRICERAKVIGISATATVPTVIGNFDLDYLRSRMQGAFCTLQGSEHARLAGAFHSSQSGYEHIRIHTQLLGAGEYSVQSWTGIFEDENLGSAVHEALERKVFKSENAPFYYHERYVRIAKVFKAFLQHRDIRSMLCLLTAHPRENSRYLDLKLLYDIFDALRYCFDKTFDTANNVVILRSGDLFEREKRVLLQRLGAGERFFVISTYQTLGAGQNLQYRIPPMLQGRLVCSNQLPPRQEKDFDAIYLDKPTNLFAGLERSWQEESFVKYLFQVEFLQEKGELSMADALAHIRKAFRCYMTGEIPREHVESVYDKQSIRMYATRAVIQAIGRLCRTNQKSPDIYIFADDRIADSLDLSVTEGRILNHEFLALVRAIENTQHRAPEPGSLESLAELTASRAARDLDHMLHDGWDERRMRKWEALRTLVLRHPTASGAQAACDPIFPNYYIQLPQKGNVLYYIQGEHLRRGSVSFLRTPVHAREDETGTRLPRLMQWQALHEHFIAKGYATQFVPNDYILSPPLWQRIYKGALGEVTGQFWFETVLGVTLEALSDPEVFELFDGKVPGKPVYVDFKNWEEGTQADWEPAVDKIRRKAAQCGCRCAVIANVLARRSYRIQRFEQGDTAFLIVPSLLRDDDGSIAIDREAADAIRACLSQDY